jgi:hypothetical protein
MTGPDSQIDEQETTRTAIQPSAGAAKSSGKARTPKPESREQSRLRLYSDMSLLLVGTTASIAGIVLIALNSTASHDTSFPLYLVLLGAAGMAWPSISSIKFKDTEIIKRAIEEVNEVAERVEQTAKAVQHNKEAATAAANVVKETAAGRGLSVDGQQETDESGWLAKLRQEYEDYVRARAPQGTVSDLDPIDDIQGWTQSGRCDQGDYIKIGIMKEMSSRWYRVKLKIKLNSPRDGASTADIYLHPTFRQSIISIGIVKGRARYDIWCYGWFTIGVAIAPDLRLRMKMRELFKRADRHPGTWIETEDFTDTCEPIRT